MRRLVLVPLLALLLTPTAAQAFFSSTITSPAPGTRLVFDHASPPTVHFAGTASTSSVDLKCVTGSAGSTSVFTVPIANNIAVAMDGTFSTDAVMPFTDLCDVYAVVSGTNPTSDSDLTNLNGALVYSAISLTRLTGGKVYDFDVDLSSTRGYDKFESFGDYPMEYQEPVDTFRYGPFIHDGGAVLLNQDPSAPSPSPSLRIDGRPAYSTSFIGYSPLKALGGWNGLAFSVTDDSGTFHVVSHEDTFDCAGGTAPDAFPPDATSCGGFKSTGVGVVADERVPGDGRTVVQNITYTSNDGMSHTVAPVLSDITEVAREWLFPGTADFLPYTTGQSPSTIAAGPATIRDRVGGDASQGFGAITYVRQPADEVFTQPGWQFTQHYQPITVPAGGSARLEFIYSEDPTSAGLDALVAADAALIGAPPSITLTSPASASAANYTLAGTVNAPETLNAFTINGQPAPVASDGSFSVPETLATGANAYTLAATDQLGRTTTTPFSVTLSSPPPPPSHPLSVRFGKAGKPKVKGRVVTTGATATCPGAGPSCSIGARVALKKRLAGRGAATVKAGATVKIKLKLTTKVAKLLKRKHRLRVKLTLTGRRTGAATTTAHRTLKLSRRR
jgi:hypothetical protein